jgi:hypothetical protein
MRAPEHAPDETQHRVDVAVVADDPVRHTFLGAPAFDSRVVEFLLEEGQIPLGQRADEACDGR